MLYGEAADGPEGRTCNTCGRTLLDYEVRVSGRCLDCEATVTQEHWEQEETRLYERWVGSREGGPDYDQHAQRLREKTFDWLRRLAREAQEAREHYMSGLPGTPDTPNTPNTPDTPEPFIVGDRVYLPQFPDLGYAGNETTPGGRVSKPSEPNIQNDRDVAPYRPVDFPNPRIYARLEFLKWRIGQGLLDDDMQAAEQADDDDDEREQKEKEREAE